MKIDYIEGNIFTNLQEGDAIMHSCNCQAKWGSGFAKELAKRFPDIYKRHKENNDVHIIGEFEYLYDDNIKFINLFTSEYYGKLKDPPDVILHNTKEALVTLYKWLHYIDSYVIKMPKINSGLFEVPWNDTESIIKEVFDKIDITFKVYSL